MRAFAAATVVAVAAVAVGAGALIASVVGSVESLGLLAGRTSIAITDLPYGLTTNEQTSALRRLADQADVDLSAIVPDRDGKPGAWTAFTIRGKPVEPVFLGAATVVPVRDSGDLDLRTTYAVDGSAAAVRAFLDDADRAGYEYADLTPGPFGAIAAALEQPPTAAVLFAVTLGTVIALVAESVRRAPRQRLRSTVGWSRRAVIAQETGAIALLTATAVLLAAAAIVLFLVVQRAGAPTWHFTAAVAALLLTPCVLSLIGGHCLSTALSLSRVPTARTPRWPRAVVATAGVALVVLCVVLGDTAAQQRCLAASLEETLVAEAVHGDDVVLGTTFTEYDQDVALGGLALGPLTTGSASMAQSSFVDQFTLVGDATVVLQEYRTVVAASGGEPVLLVPSVLASATDALRDAARADLEAGWEVEGTEPGNALTVHAVAVPSTADITQAVIDWTRALPPEAPTWPEIPVLVVPDPADIAPNRIGTAVANGEVRFDDRSALIRAVHDAGLDGVVLQVRRVGAVVEGQLAAIRHERRTAATAVVLAAAAVVFATSTLVADHRLRSRRPARLWTLVGRHPVALHRRFVATTVVAAAGTAGVARLVTGGSSAGSLGASAVTSTIAALSSAVLVTVVLVLTACGRGRGR